MHFVSKEKIRLDMGLVTQIVLSKHEVSSTCLFWTYFIIHCCFFYIYFAWDVLLGLIFVSEERLKELMLFLGFFFFSLTDSNRG